MNRTSTHLRKFLGAALALFTFAAALAFVPKANAQEVDLDLCQSGQIWYFAFPDTVRNAYDTRHPPTQGPEVTQIHVWSPVDQTIRITSKAGSNITKKVQAGKFEIIEIKSNPVVNQINQRVQNVHKMTSEYPVVMYCYMATRFGGEAWTPLPVEAWGTEYYAAALPAETIYDIIPCQGCENNYGKAAQCAPSEILMIAAFDGTTITVNPNGQLEGFVNTQSIPLNEGEAFLLESWCDTTGGDQPDLGGSLITSNKPIGVISGNTRAMVVDREAGLAKNSFKNMHIEWLAPSDQHGTEFVYMPTWDQYRPTGNPTQEAVRENEFVRIYGTREGTTEIGYTLPGQITETSNTERTKYFMDVHGEPIARGYKTKQAAQAMQNSQAVIIYKGITGSGTWLGAAYESESSYMVEMTPREQWTDFAPFHVPIPFSQMRHYVNLVTDTLNQFNVFYGTGGGAATQRFTFNRGKIEGTDLVWGQMTVNPGQDYVIEGRDNAKFSGFAYGLWKGFERYVPGQSKKEDRPVITGSGGDGDGEEVLHPSDYYEENAIAYGYPLVPARCVLGPGDSLLIDKVIDCTEMTITIEPVNDNPVGLRSIFLDQAKSENARIVFVDPANPGEIVGRKQRTIFKVIPINVTRDAHGVVVIKDRTGKETLIEYEYFAERVKIDPEELDFGQVTLNEKSKELCFTLENEIDKDILVKAIKMNVGNSDFTIESIDPALDPEVTLKKGEKMTVCVTITPTIPNKFYEDSVLVQLGCIEVGIPVKAATVAPCLMVDDLNFGTLVIDSQNPEAVKTLDLTLCNEGNGEVKFDNRNPNGPDALTWILENFEVAQDQIDALQDVVLGPGECHTIRVTFRSNKTGVYKTTGRFWASTRDCRDTSVWTAVVIKPGPNIEGYDWGRQWVVSANECTKNLIPQYETEVPMYNTGTSVLTIQTIELLGDDAAFFELDAADLAANLGRQIQPANATDTQKVWQTVYFKPVEERQYTATIKMTTNAGESVEALLLGTGIESHVQLPDYDFGSHLYTAPGSVDMVQNIRVQALPTRELTITQLLLINPNDATDDPPRDFTIDAAFNPGYPIVLQPNEFIEVPVRFIPNGRDVESPVELRVVGDHAFCDDSVGVIRGAVYGQHAVAEGHAFDNLLTCFSQDGFVMLINDGSVDVEVTDNFNVDDPTGYFTFDDSDLPQVVRAGDTLRIPVHFEPTSETDDSNPFTAVFTFDVKGLDGSDVEGNHQATVTGAARQITIPAHINRDYVRYPGSTLEIPVTLDGDISEAQAGSFILRLTYDGGMMLLQKGDQAWNTTGTLTEGWTVIENGRGVDPNTGEYFITLEFTAPNGKVLSGPGDIVLLNFLTFIGSVTESELPFDINLVGRPCATIEPQPGLARIDSVCGLSFRLIELAEANYALDQNNPNPFNPTTDITFSVGLEGPTTLDIYNAAGEKVARLVDANLASGTYSVTWDATGHPSGLYYYRLTSSHWSRTGTMILRK